LLENEDIWSYLQATAHFVSWTMIIQVLLGLGLALLINRNFKGASFWTTVILIPMMLSPAVVGTFWTYLYQPQTGIFSYIVNIFVNVGPLDMIGSVALAPWSIIIVDTWMWTPYIMLLCLAGLRSIPSYLYEAAEIDRANAWQKFWYITLPRVMPFLMLAVLFRGIENFKMFDMVVELTSGGPGSTTEVASINLKREAFEKWRTGYASAFAVILFVTVFGLGSIYVKALNRVKQ
jgi:multiple sugar transport system permease protein